MKIRIDSTLNFEIRPGEIQDNPDGSITVPAFLGRTGILEYPEESPLVRQAKLPADLFEPASLATLRNLPVTVGHPPDGVTPENAAKEVKGQVLFAAAETPFIMGSVRITDPETIALVKSDGPEALREGSLGYSCDVIPQSGDYQGLVFDAIQRNLRYNHFALLKRGGGRAGPTVGLRLDGEKRPMKITIKVDGKPREVDKGGEEHLAFLDARILTLETEAKELRTKADSATPEQIHKLASRRAGLLSACQLLDPKEERIKADKKAEMPNEAILKELLGLVAPEFDVSNRGPEGLQTAYELLVLPKLGGAPKPPAPESTDPNTPEPPVPGAPPAPSLGDSKQPRETKITTPEPPKDPRAEMVKHQTSRWKAS